MAQSTWNPNISQLLLSVPLPPLPPNPIVLLRPSLSPLQNEAMAKKFSIAGDRASLLPIFWAATAI